jgi:methylenetetrahydrofolate dehydrogenase (NADP+)/methenyltetrahydrofolate cyclohydrolase
VKSFKKGGGKMAAKIISGTEVARQIREELAGEVAALKEKHNVVPGLVTILVDRTPPRSAM